MTRQSCQQEPRAIRRTTATAIAVIILCACSSSVLAQWTQPDGSGNINSTNTGNVGIGTSSPAHKLEVVGNINGTNVFSSKRVFRDAYSNSGSPAIWYKIATLPVTGNPTGDLLDLRINGGRYDSINKFGMEVKMGNRNGFSAYVYSASGQVAERLYSRVVAYNNGGAVDVYLYLPGNYGFASYSSIGVEMTATGWATGPTLYPTSAGVTTAPPGTLVFDSSTASIPLTVDNSGNVGVGTTAPAYALDVNGSVRIPTGNYLHFTRTGTNRNVGLTNASNNDNLGMVTAYPTSGTNVASMFSIVPRGTGAYGVTSQLSLYNNDYIVDAANSERLQIGAYGTKFAIFSGPFGTGVNRPIDIYANGTPGQLFLNTNGVVGIGTSTPGSGYRLDVQGGSVNASGGLCINGDCKTAWSQVGGSGSQWSGTAGSNIYYNSGNVGVGTNNPTSKLFVGSGTPAVQTLAGLNVALGGNSYLSASNGTENIFMGADGSGYGIVGTLSNHGVGIRTNNVERMRIDTAGKVGIGTGNPTEKLEVNGNLKLTGTGNITTPGTIVGGNIQAKYQDVAEWVESSEELIAGTVVVLDSVKANQVIASTRAYDNRVAGVISRQPGIVLGEHAEGRVLVATTGRVKVKVDASNGPINIGDLLVTSRKTGVAMKSVPVKIGGVRFHRPGTLIGKALEPLARGTDEILVLLSLQ